jgi:hypothetical protein
MGVSSWENHLFLWAIYTMAMLNNQRVPKNLCWNDLQLLDFKRLANDLKVTVVYDPSLANI